MVITNKIKLIVLSIFLTLLCVACEIQYYETKYTKPRPIKENVFSYAKKKFYLQDTLLIDTMSIYILIDTTCIDCAKEKSVSFFRFFANGKYVAMYEKIMDIDENINNLEKGFIGYYYITKKNVLKMQYFSWTNGGQTRTEFGLFDNGDLLVYDQHPEFALGNQKLLEWMAGDTKKRWKKVKVSNLKPVIPNW
ncbi:MAG: hypothetical protein LBT48_01750 [Prevotellaceae bacterium]|jgi:hypothetical protein|nr:hypothetical protein [Prevotellaceae bacterium]